MCDMSKAKFKKHLSELNHEELKHELLNLYTQIEDVRKYYAMELGSEKDRTRIFDKAKKEIEAKYTTKSYRKPRRPRIQKVNAILSRMSKSSVFEHELIDLYLFDIEKAMIFSIKYHFYSHVLGNHLVKTFEKTLQMIRRAHVWDLFDERCRLVISRSEDIPEIHWAIVDLYQQYKEG